MFLSFQTRIVLLLQPGQIIKIIVCLDCQYISWIDLISWQRLLCIFKWALPVLLPMYLPLQLPFFLRSLNSQLGEPFLKSAHYRQWLWQHLDLTTQLWVVVSKTYLTYAKIKASFIQCFGCMQGHSIFISYPALRFTFHRFIQLQITFFVLEQDILRPIQAKLMKLEYK